MKVKKTSYPPANIGTSFMLVIFLVLCMIIFAVLSLSSALRDYNYSQKTADRTTAYYEANNLAEETLAKIDNILLEAYTNPIPENELQQQLLSIEGVTISSDDTHSGFLLEYAVTINEDEILQVILNIFPNNNERYTIISWKQIFVTEWEGDQSISVLGSE